MEFEEFLKQEESIIEENKKEPSWHGQFKEFQGFKQRLGEWAWQYAKGRIPSSECDSVEQACQNIIAGNILQIAVDCLSKAEVEKRLKERSR